jgi:phospholipid/cholesterol/gamma-HCH transport system substrate-binding protein
MITARIRAQLIAFAIIALVATSYLGAKYVGIDPFSSSYQVKVEMPDAGGLFVNSEVTYRGVQIGEVSDMEVTDEGMVATLEIEGDAPEIPRDVSATVANRSAIGEQYLDLRGESSDDEQLSDGDLLTAGRSDLPPSFDDVLRSGRDFAESVPKDSLRTVIDETYSATRGVGPDLGRLVDTSLDWAKTSQDNLLVTTRLIESSSTVLDTQIASSGDIKAFSSDLGLIAETLRTSDGDLRALINNTPATAVEIDRLFTQVGQPLGVLMSNLVSTAQVFGVNAAGVEDALIRVPDAVSVGWLVAGTGQINLGLSTSFTKPTPCTTGYGGTPVRPGTETSPGQSFNTLAGCAVPPSTGVNVRGPQAAPALPGATAAAPSAAPATQLATGSVGAPAGYNVVDVTSLADLMGGSR